MVKEKTFLEKLEELRRERDESLQRGGYKPTVVISGAGPAGLIRGIYSLLNGNPTTILEKRGENEEGRENVVSLHKSAVEMLQTLGIYHYLREKKLVYAPNRRGFLKVCIKDLEMAMKEMISALSSEPIIHYRSQIVEIIRQEGKRVDLVVKQDDVEKTIREIDLLIVAEGANSVARDSFLGISRKIIQTDVLWCILICEKGRKNIFKNIKKMMLWMYFHSLFLFQFLFQKQHFWNADRKIVFAGFFKTPKKIQLGIVLSESEINALTTTKEPLKSKTSFLASLFANYFFAFASFQRWAFAGALEFGFIDENFDFHIIPTGCQLSEVSCGRLDETVYLVVGDAFVTLDISTGAGCNFAIVSAVYFQKLIKQMESYFNLDTYLTLYDQSIYNHVNLFINESTMRRNYYQSVAFDTLKYPLASSGVDRF